MKNLFKKITAAVLTAALTVTSLATGVFAAPTNKNYKHVDVELVGEAQIDGKPVQIKLDDKTVKMEFAGKTYTPNDSDPEDGAPRFEYKIPSNTEDSITITGNYTAFDTSDIVYKATDGYAYYKTETKSGSRFNKPSGEGWKYDGLGSFTWSRKVYAKVVKSDSFTMVFTPDTFEEARLNCPSHGGSYEGLDFKISLQDVIDPKYTVNWVVEGVIVETDENQKKDAEHVYNGETPVKEATAENTYEFDKWSDPVIDEEKKTITYTAEFVSKVQKYTVTTKYDVEDVADITDVVETFEYGTDYTTTGWSGFDPVKYNEPVIAGNVSGTVTENVTVTYTYSIKEFTVTFVDENGNKLDEDTVKYGKSADAPALPEEDGKSFSWDKTFDNITEDTTVTAISTINSYDYKISYVAVDINGTPVQFNGTLPTDENGSAEFGTDVSKDVSNGFAGFEVYSVTPATITSTPANNVVIVKLIPIYNVSFVDYNGATISYETYKHGETITVPENPTRASDDSYNYTFAGWDKEIETTATDNATYTATYTAKAIEIKVQFFLRDPGQGMPASGASIGVDNYKLIATDITANVLSDEVDLSKLGNVKSTWIEDLEGLDEKYFKEDYNLPTSLSDAVIKAYNLPATDSYEIVWYVLKKESDGIVHIDGYIKTYTVTFKYLDENGVETETSTRYVAGSMPVVPEITKTFTTDETITTFTNWDSEIVSVTGDATYKALYNTETIPEETTPQDSAPEETTPQNTTPANTTTPAETTTTEEVVIISDDDSPAADKPTDSDVDGGNAEVTAESGTIEIPDDDSAAGETPADSSTGDNPHTADDSNIAIVTLVALISIIGAACAMSGKDKLSAKK